MRKKAKKKDKEELDLKKLKKTADGKYILPLKKPVKFGSKTISQLELIEPTAKHLRDLSADPTLDDMLNIVADLAGESDSLIDMLSMSDASQAVAFFNAFD